MTNEAPASVSLGHARCTNSSPKAICVVIAGSPLARWIPQSVIHDDSEVYKKGDSGNLVVMLWWAEKEKLA